MKWLLVIFGLVGLTGQSQAQTPIPNDPFRDAPAPVVRPRPVEPAPAPQPRPAPAPQHTAGSGYPVQAGQSFRDCADCPEMLVIPAGRFVMGSPSSETGRDSDEGPQREVSVSRPLAVGKFEVTFGEWDACVSAGGCSHRPSDNGWGRGRRPLMGVSWDDVQEYVRWLSSRTGRTYRLLTEAEWEYAARAGTTTPYSFGTTISQSQANFYLLNFRGHIGRTQAVGSYPANAWGLHDMHGNVLEWVQDCYVNSYAGAPVEADQAVESGGCSARVVRGGSWPYTIQYLRSAYRYWFSPGFRFNNYIGFRVARRPG